MKRKVLEYILVVILLSPLLFINLRNSHDWGDDFAMYITEAKNITEGKPFYESKFKYYDYGVQYAPPFYSYGFPLLLAPVIKIWGINYLVLNIYMALWMMLFGLIAYIYLRRQFTLLASLAVLLVFFLSTYFLFFKIVILSDVPFCCFLWWAVMRYQRSDQHTYPSHIITGLILAFAMGIRSIGIVVLGVIGIEMGIVLLQYALRKVSKEDCIAKLKPSAVIMVATIVFAWIQNKLIFPTPPDLAHYIMHIYSYNGYYDMILQNINIYSHEFTNLFLHDMTKYTFIPLYTSSIMLTLALIGLFYTARNGSRFAVMFFAAYLLSVLLYPVSSQGFRYLLPILPIMMTFIIYGAKAIEIKGYSMKWLGVILILITLISQKKEYNYIIAHQHETVWPSPMGDYNNGFMNFLHDHISDSALIVCQKPRAIQLFTHKYTCLIPSGDMHTEVFPKLHIIKPDYILAILSLNDQDAIATATAHGDSLVFQDWNAKIYRCKPYE